MGRQRPILNYYYFYMIGERRWKCRHPSVLEFAKINGIFGYSKQQALSHCKKLAAAGTNYRSTAGIVHEFGRASAQGTAAHSRTLHSEAKVLNEEIKMNAKLT